MRYAMAMAALVVLGGCKREQKPASEARAPLSKGANTRASPPATRLTAATIGGAGRIPVGTAHRAFFAWKGKEVSVQGHVHSAMSTAMLGERPSLVGAPGSTKKLVECAMKTADTSSFPREEAVVLRGTVGGELGFEGAVLMTGCTLVSRGQAPAPAAEPNPERIDPGRPIRAEDLHAEVAGWHGKEVTLVGNYWGTTVSTVSGAERIRLDFTDPAGNKVAACFVQVEPKTLAGDRKDVVVSGTITKPVFDMVTLDPCRVVNRS
jgi:hypothetical protein